MLYADDILLFLGDLKQSLTTATDIIKRFVFFSGLSINLEKSFLLPIDGAVQEVPESDGHLQIVDSFKYLGVTINSKFEAVYSKELGTPDKNISSDMWYMVASSIVSGGSVKPDQNGMAASALIFSPELPGLDPRRVVLEIGGPLQGPNLEEREI